MTFRPLDDVPALPRTTYSNASKPLDAPALTGRVEADVVIIGGGFAGASAALHAAEAGASAVLLEGREIGWGAAGRNAGHVAPHSTKFEPRKVLEMYGPVYGPRMNEVGAGAPAFVTGIAERFGFDISVVRGGILTAAHDDAAMAMVRSRAAYWAENGGGIDVLDRAETAETIGGGDYVGSIVDRRGIAVNPLSFVRGMARAAASLGASIFEHTDARSISRQGDRWLVTTGGGSVLARNVLICTNAYTGNLWPGLNKTIIPIRVYQMWTEPLPEAVRGQVLRGISCMLDTRRVTRGARLHPDGRLQFGGGPGFGRERAPDIDIIRKRVGSFLPIIDKVKIEGWWSGWVAKGIADGWRINRLDDGVYTAIGCNGRGVAMGSVMGRELARLATGTPPDALCLPVTPSQKIPFHAFHEPGAWAALWWNKWRDRRDVAA